MIVIENWEEPDVLLVRDLIHGLGVAHIRPDLERQDLEQGLVLGLLDLLYHHHPLGDEKLVLEHPVQERDHDLFLYQGNNL